ncbi:flavin-containing monooxygenase FMO GS-OX-like 4, partial [Triticum dicoccoides]|uniref:flavin-containing monooxygenase FMO GS-OX-like 4 n=1 Tax=Triticum dicoccoides TaxID=85692 RepID=UPI00188EB35C
IDCAEEDGIVVFQGGSRVKADSIVHYTGYLHIVQVQLLVLGDDSAIMVDDNRVGPLYKHVFPPRLAPSISFVGLPFKGFLFPVFQLQSSWVAGVLSGRIELPSSEQMTQDVASFYSDMEARGHSKRFTHDLGVGTFEYEDWLVERCGLERIEEWRKEIYVAARGRVRDQPDSYRDKWDDDAQLLEQAQ